MKRIDEDFHFNAKVFDGYRSGEHPSYLSWLGMRQRCYYEKHNRYEKYGGRGIEVCPEWNESFEAFVKDMGIRPEGASIDRIDNDGNYEPSNCRWATGLEQARNRGLRTDSLTKERYIRFDKSRERFILYIRRDRGNLSKSFRTIEEAIELRDLILQEESL